MTIKDIIDDPHMNARLGPSSADSEDWYIVLADAIVAAYPVLEPYMYNGGEFEFVDETYTVMKAKMFGDNGGETHLEVKGAIDLPSESFVIHSWKITSIENECGKKEKKLLSTVSKAVAYS